MEKIKHNISFGMRLLLSFSASLIICYIIYTINKGLVWGIISSIVIGGSILLFFEELRKPKYIIILFVSLIIVSFSLSQTYFDIFVYPIILIISSIIFFIILSIERNKIGIYYKMVAPYNLKKHSTTDKLGKKTIIECKFNFSNSCIYCETEVKEKYKIEFTRLIKTWNFLSNKKSFEIEVPLCENHIKANKKINSILYEFPILLIFINFIIGILSNFGIGYCLTEFIISYAFIYPILILGIYTVSILIYPIIRNYPIPKTISFRSESSGSALGIKIKIWKESISFSFLHKKMKDLFLEKNPY